jgi:hypothetical protein
MRRTALHSASPRSPTGSHLGEVRQATDVIDRLKIAIWATLPFLPWVIEIFESNDALTVSLAWCRSLRSFEERSQLVLQQE